MAKPNRTVAAFRRKSSFFTPEQENANAVRRIEQSRRENPQQWEIMDAVSQGRMTPEEGAEAMRKVINSGS